MQTFRLSLVISSIILLAGCGFRPMAAADVATPGGQALSGERASVDIQAQTRRDGRALGQLFRVTLEDLINPGQKRANNQTYQLRVSLSPIVSPGFVAPDGKAQRFIVNLQSGYELRRIADNELIEHGTLSRSSSYSNLPNSYFSTFVAEQDTLKRLTQQLAEEYRFKLASLISNPPAKPSEMPDNFLENDPSIPTKSAITTPDF